MTIKEALEVLQKEYGCRTARDNDCLSFGSTCDGCEHYVDTDTSTEALKAVLDAFGSYSELPNTSQTKFKPGDKFLLEIGEKRIGLDEYSIVGTDLYVWGSLLEKLTPYTPDGDAISGQAAIDVAVETADEWDGGYSSTRAYMITNAINKIVPYVQTEQKKGRWIPVDDPSITGRCSVCGFESHLCEDDVYGYDYCPNCGARLEVVDE